jgi:hypothetical protein
MTIDIQKGKGKVGFIMQRLSKAALFVVVEKRRASAVYAERDQSRVIKRTLSYNMRAQLV